MSSVSGKSRCIICDKEKRAVRCEGCLQLFCYDHLTDHRQELNKQLDLIERTRDLFRQTLSEQLTHPQIALYAKQIDQWEDESVRVVRQAAVECRQLLVEHTAKNVHNIEANLAALSDHLKRIRQENDFNEVDLDMFKQKLKRLGEKLQNLPHISISQDPAPLIYRFSATLSNGSTAASSKHPVKHCSSLSNDYSIKHSNNLANDHLVKCSDNPSNDCPNKHSNNSSSDHFMKCSGNSSNDCPNKHSNNPSDDYSSNRLTNPSSNHLINPSGNYCVNHSINHSINPYNNTLIHPTWKQSGSTVAGSIYPGHQSNQLCNPLGIHVDDSDPAVSYIADYGNHRIVKWKCGMNDGEVVAGGAGQGYRSNQLSYPTDILLDKVNDTLIICDQGNRRIVCWSRSSKFEPHVLISNIVCWGIAMDCNGDLYISDYEKDEVRRWTNGDTEGTIVAGGNGRGNQLNQLNYPSYIFVDLERSVYVSDSNNNRVMKWVKGAKEGIVVAGGQGQGDSLTQLSNPQGLVVDQCGHVYVADSHNHRVVRWLPNSTKGSIMVGGNGQGARPNQFNCPLGISFDRHGNLWVVDWGNNRVQKFTIDIN
ncbi:unnamed protein product [Adineta ricciae]|uniref:Uncharacterized protein n=1 Tax=Adineta ricciae TaxID=249248 RepID=A0A813TTU1_ADIRI|nr:unnamed protein product [Adineta ricciae]CAF1563453.1 unnamed protein product [Adineta ricciae]